MADIPLAELPPGTSHGPPLAQNADPSQGTDTTPVTSNPNSAESETHPEPSRSPSPPDIYIETPSTPDSQSRTSSPDPVIIPPEANPVIIPPEADVAYLPPGEPTQMAPPPQPEVPSEQAERVEPAPDISPHTESGWGAVAKSIHDVDEQKIKDYKEDIDTILVFAGLYSAVLSALVAISFQSLQPDLGLIMVLLLTQVATQTHSYSINGEFLNSTAPPLDLNTVSPNNFQPTTAAKRVNVLWFASLTLSLVSASFGIMVKQWLREYLAGDNVSPQTHLRIRHYRSPGLEHWHVFGIAALLPLVLQLSLALFFVGLCFFTLDVHTSIGYTTIPLVAGWALLFLAAVFAPSLSPRCPYKIPLFKPVMEHLRLLLFRGVQPLKQKLKLLDKSEWLKTLAYGEAEAAKDSSFDADLLMNIDASQGDDQLLQKMCSAAAETFSSQEEKVKFVMQIMELRLGRKFPKGRLPIMYDLTDLPLRTCTILLDTVADTLKPELKRYTPNQVIIWEDWSWNCLMLLCARLPCLPSEKATTVLAILLAGTQGVRFQTLFKEMFDPVPLEDRSALVTHLFLRLRPVFNHLTIWQVVACVFSPLFETFCTCAGKECVSLQLCLRTHAETIPRGIESMACDIITRCELDDVKNKVVWRGWHIDYLLTLCERHLSSPSPQQWHASLVDLLNIVLLREDLVREFGRNLYHRVNYNYLAMQMFIHTFSISADKAEILKNVHAAFANYLVETYQTPDLLDHSFYLHILYFLDGHMSAMQYSISVHTSGVTSWLHLPIWHLILRTAHTALQNYNGLYVGLSTELFQIAHSILQRIDHLDDQWSIKRGDGGPRVDPDPAVDFNGWAEEFNVNAAFFSDELIIDLVRFMPSAAEANVSRRVRRLELLWSKEGETHTPGRRSPGGRRGFQYAWSETDEAPPLPLPVAPVPVTPTQAPTIPSNPLQRVAPKRANTFMPLQAIPEDVAESSGSGSNGVVSTVPQAEAGSGSMTAANSRLPAEGNDANGTGEPGAQTSGVNGVGQQEHRGTLPTIVLHPPEPEPPILMYIPKAPQSDVVDRGPGGEPGGTGVGPGVGNGPGGVGNGPGGIGNGPGGIGDGPAGIGNGPAGMGNGSGGSGQEGMEGGTG